MKRRIPLEPENNLYYIVDSNFFANKYLKPGEGANAGDSKRIENSLAWWEVINWQIDKKFAIVYINELCIAETFKIIAKKYYQERLFGSNRYHEIRRKISFDIQLNVRELIAKSRIIKFHNLNVDRDIIVGTSRYLEIAHKNGLQSLSIVDLTILSSAKYLCDFYRINKDQIFIFSGDEKLRKCANKANEGTCVIDSLNPKNNYQKYFIT